MAHFIAQNQDGTPSFYSPSAGRAVAGGAGFIADFKSALGFARRSDAQVYIDAHLPHVSHICSIVEKEVAPA